MMSFIKSGFLVFLLLFFFVSKVYAQTPMEGGIYRIEPELIQEKTVSQATIVSDLTKFGDYSFDISDSLLDFGKPLPTNPVIRSNSIKVNSGSVSYFLKAYENHQLLSPKSGSIIPDTICDQADCSENTSSIWKSVLIYGFGYRCEGTSTCGQSFPNQDSFKQFANKSKDEIPQHLINEDTSENNVDISYKINISSKESSQTYSNVVTFLLLPSF